MSWAWSQLGGCRRIEAGNEYFWYIAAISTLILLACASCTGTLVGTGTTPTVAAGRTVDFALAPGQGAVGQIRHYVVHPGEVFPDIARRFDLGYTELATANPGVDPWLPGTGRDIVIPSLYVLPKAPHNGVVINLAQWRLFYFPPGGGRVETHPVGLGVIGRHTPLGVTRIVRKEPHPTWYVPASIRVKEHLPAAVKPGPDNPLGDYALHLGWASYLIHGTNKPDGVGRNVSHGCVRLYPEDIAGLFGEVSVRTPVRTVNQPATAGWLGDRLYVEVYPSKAQAEQIDTDRRVRSDPARGVAAVVKATAGRYANIVDWRKVAEAAERRTGTPVLVADRSKEMPRTGSAPLTEDAASDRLGSPGM